MKMPKEARELADYLDRPLTCGCGREHYAPLKAVSIRKDAIEDLPAYVKKLGFQHPYLICDLVTYEIAGKRCAEVLSAAGCHAQTQVLTHVGFDEATVGELLIHMPADCDLCVAVGTGAINDMTRFFSHRMGRPFFTVATAAPIIPHRKSKIKRGSRMILMTAPRRVEIMANLGFPSARMMGFMACPNI